jgi:hypothetical protein
MCLAVEPAPMPFRCTLPAGHDGPHVAVADGDADSEIVTATWPRADDL